MDGISRCDQEIAEIESILNTPLPLDRLEGVLLGLCDWSNEKRFLMRTFETGATRDSDNNKLDFEGFLSPVVLDAYAEYMNKNRVQADGKLRDSDNWQKGIPKTAYMKSMWRHFMDVWRAHRGVGKIPMQEALCALLFNVMGYLFEELKCAAETSSLPSSDSRTISQTGSSPTTTHLIVSPESSSAAQTRI